MKKIVIDCLGGDNSYLEFLYGANDKVNKIDYELILVGPKDELTKAIVDNNLDLGNVEIIDASYDVDDKTNPMTMWKDQMDSALVKALRKTNDSDVVGLITASSTGCVLVGSMFHMGLMETVKFPALGAMLKHYNKNYYCLLDCGATLDCKPADLVRFAKMGSAAISAHSRVENPRVGLLSVGSSKSKGNDLVKKTYELLENTDMNFVGNIEENDCFSDKCDVLVCDGFSGNTILKVAESVAMFVTNLVTSKGFNDKEALDHIDECFNYNANGASVILGTKKILLKAHGAADRKTISSVIDQMIRLDSGNFTAKLEESLTK